MMSEEHKEHKESKQKHLKMNKWFIVLAVIAILAIVLFYFGFSSLTIPALVNQNQPATGELAKFTTTGTEMIAKDTTQNLPYYESATLEPGRYSVQVTSSIPVWIRVYDQANFNSWQASGSNGSTKAGTNLGESDKVTQFTRTFDVNTGEEGKYYLMILGSGSASLQLKVTQILKF
jgi:hypothetical protein